MRVRCCIAEQSHAHGSADDDKKGPSESSDCSRLPSTRLLLKIGSELHDADGADASPAHADEGAVMFKRCLQAKQAPEASPDALEVPSSVGGCDASIGPMPYGAVWSPDISSRPCAWRRRQLRGVSKQRPASARRKSPGGRFLRPPGRWLSVALDPVEGAGHPSSPRKWSCRPKRGSPLAEPHIAAREPGRSQVEAFVDGGSPIYSVAP